MKSSVSAVLLVFPVWLALCGPVQAASAAPVTDQEAAHLLNRLAFGPRPGDIASLQQMGADAYIAQQLHPENIPLPDTLQQKLAQLSILSASPGTVLYQYQKALKDARDDSEESKKHRRELVGSIMEQTAAARLWRALESPRQLEEVMVDFWFNHFNVYEAKGFDRALIASYERDAIRPYVFGHFRDLLGATARHPAMLFYLDNWLSTAADFHANPRQRGAQGQKGKSAGLNENYARELMELHTLGVDGGYTQNDVTELARMLTGWTFDPRSMVSRNQNFVFDMARHDDGSKQWLGQTIRADGRNEGEHALDVLAIHPATAHHLSFQLAQYFVADQPPTALVERLAQRYLDTQGDIRAVLDTLFHSPEFRSPANYGSKYKTPYQFTLSALRATGTPVQNIRPVLGTLAQLGMPLYGSQTPDGYKNTETAWLNPDALSRRINFATALGGGYLPLLQPLENGQAAGMKHIEKNTEKQMEKISMEKTPPRQLMPPPDPVQLQTALGPLLTPVTLNVIHQQPAALRAALMLGSPDFMQH